MSSLFDVAVIGSGPAGIVASHQLGLMGYSVLLIDPQFQPKRKVGESLPAAARPLLQKLGLFSILENSKHTEAYGNCSAWGSPNPTVMDFLRDPNGLGWHLNRCEFEKDLHELVLQNNSIEFEQGFADNFLFQDMLWFFQVGSKNYSAKILIDATGRSASVAKKLGAQQIKDDRLMALYGWISSQDSVLDSLTWVESAPQGWWYTSQLPDKTRIISFHLDADQIGSHNQLEKFWRTHISETVHIQKLISPHAEILDLKCGPAWGAQLDRAIGSQWLATGDAALSFDPLSSQGIFNALYTGMKSGMAAAEFLQGNSAAFLDYERRLFQIRQAYLNHRSLYYSSEQRWPHSLFWQRRQQPPKEVLFSL